MLADLQPKTGYINKTSMIMSLAVPSSVHTHFQKKNVNTDKFDHRYKILFTASNTTIIYAR